MDLSTTRWIGLFVSAYVSSVLASIGGIGGGGILIPFYSLIADIEIKDAIVLSIVTIAGNSMIRGIYYIRKRNSLAKNRYLPNYDLIRLIVPFDGNTAYLGYLINEVAPNIVILVIIILMISFMIFKTIKKVIYYAKNKEMKYYSIIVVDNINVKIDEELQIENGRKGETKKDLFKNIIFTLLSVGLIAFFTIIRENSERDYIIYIIQVLIVGVFGYMTIDHIKTNYLLRKKKKFNFIDGDINWNESKSFLKYAGAASTVGFFSTMLGIGGGMIMNPIMLGFNITPEVVLATSSISTFFSSVISALQFIVTDGVEWYHGVLFLLGGLASLTSIIILGFLQKKIKFIITCILTIALILSLILLTVVNIIKMVDEGLS